MKPRTKIMTCWPDWMLPTDVRSGRENLNESRNAAESGARSIKREVVLTRIFPQQQNYPHDATCSHTKFRDQNIFREDYTSSFMIHFVRNQDMSRCSDKTFDRLINPMAFLHFTHFRDLIELTFNVGLIESAFSAIYSYWIYLFHEESIQI